MAIHLPIGPLKTRSVLEPVPRYEPSTYQPISRWHNHMRHRGRSLDPPSLSISRSIQCFMTKVYTILSVG